MRSKIVPIVIALLFIGLGSFLKSDFELEGAPLTTRDRIYIEGNSDFTSSNGVTGGSGIKEDPFVIEGWSINASKQGGIIIRNVSAPFIIRDVHIYDGYFSTPFWSMGINIWNATMFRIESSLSERNEKGIYIGSGDNFTISRNTIIDNIRGIKLDYSVDFNINDNNIKNCSTGIGHSWEMKSRGNIWGNDIQENTDGMYLSYVSGVEVSYNTISGSSRYGLRSSYCETNLLHQ